MRGCAYPFSMFSANDQEILVQLYPRECEVFEASEKVDLVATKGVVSGQLHHNIQSQLQTSLHRHHFFWCRHDGV